MRSLVHIEKIHSIEPIDGADKIELVKLLDWQCVAKKGEFKIGDLAVYHEIDCVLPEKPEYEFLRDKKFRIRTIKLRGCLSQGLALPLSVLPDGNYKEGQNVTELVGAVHHDKDSRVNFERSKKISKSPLLKFLFKFSLFRKIYFFFNKKAKGYQWPEFVSHTDEENVQSLFSKIKAQYGDKSFYVTEKVDYQSATYFTRTVKKPFLFLFKRSVKEFGVLSRTQWKKTDDGSLWWQNAKKYNIENILRKYDRDLTIQGESGDTKVQGNKYKITEPTFWVFNIIDNQTGYHFSLEEMEAFCKENNLNIVPVLDRSFKLPETVLELIEYSKGKSKINNKTEREGVVLRLIEDGKKLVSCKVKNPDFLIKFKE